MRKEIILIILLTVAVLIAACKKENNIDNTNTLVYDTTPYTLTYGIFAAPPIATDNKLTIQGVKLGRMLFYEKMLSSNNTQACASCHFQQFAFSDTARFSIGVKGLKGNRNAMSAVNMAWNTNGFFWDGRSELLRHQSLKPILDELEMNETLDNVIAKLNASESYKNQFFRAFGSNEITSNKISLALEQFMNSIVSSNSKYDKYVRKELSLDSSEERGRKLFFAEYNPNFPQISGADCAHCHAGDNFSNNKYMNNGLKTEAEMLDIGREKVTKMALDKGKFKVPTLRNIALTAPYMADGSLQTLEEVVEHYNSGIKASTTLDATLEYTRTGGGLKLTPQNKADLVAFLKTLTDTELIKDTRYGNPF
jgi:cytochrome c peroxidase